MSIVDRLLDLIYPPRCLFCRRLLSDSGKGICRQCADSIPRLMAEEGRKDIKNVRLCVAPFLYRDEVRESLHRYKFNGAAAYGRIYAEFIAKSIDENAISCDIISWVPLSRRRLRERGYDQAELIARALSAKMGVPCERLLVKVKNNTRQSTITGQEQRKANVAGVYRSIAREELLGKRVLLVDDIVTTGATISECAAVLKTAGCNEIYAAAAATRM